MAIDWNELTKEMSPLKDYEDLQRRFREAFVYPFVCETYNISMPAIAGYTRRLLGGDPRDRYAEYAQALIGTFDQLHLAGVRDIMDLVAQVSSANQFEMFIDKTTIPAKDVIAVLKYLVYWVIPMKKYLSGLVKKDSPLMDAVKVLRDFGIRTNLDILDQGLTLAGRKAIAETSGLPEAEINELVNWADFSRLPWASKATISNIMGAGYGSLAALGHADPEQLYQDFFRYGKSIGKNLKLGNEIESSHRIAKILPVILVE